MRESLLQAIDVVAVDEGEAWGQGPEGGLLGLLPGGGQGAQGAAVEALAQRHDAGGPVVVRKAPLAGDLDGALVGLGTGV